ncbi:Gamma-glutamyl cyclotransferase, AIG2-like [Novosphingobium mathurense]|uniref:Gamma-glutamyl cyclotransferase, AIG2-like n=2 Tax=Sphingomonadaceae TaxID=41297 RepID=A0A1U6HEJ0_9SPHN|nr:hypothetical protein SPHV1_2420072 [Novosphingobium sp. KN65.2]SLJ94161.1 Gamma-glutamyl cyclotransferase, AIG2-like [Novosphingobium mathurense]
MGEWIAARCGASAEASVPGRIHAIRVSSGWFPALVPAASAQRVRGTLCDLELAAGELSILDRYEGREYRRAAMPVRTDQGLRIAAQVYLWRIPLPAHARPIVGGDFLAWLKESRSSAFTTLRNGV